MSYYGESGTAIGSNPIRNVAQIAPPPPSTPVLMELSLRIGDVKSLHGVLDELETRLGPVLRPAQPTVQSGNGTAPAAARSDVAEQIERLGYGVQQARDRIASLLERLEV